MSCCITHKVLAGLFMATHLCQVRRKTNGKTMSRLDWKRFGYPVGFPPSPTGSCILARGNALGGLQTV